MATPPARLQTASMTSDALESCQVPPEQVEELRALSQRFNQHMARQFAYWERLENYARKQKTCW